jgi:hypothetical protein
MIVGGGPLQKALYPARPYLPDAPPIVDTNDQYIDAVREASNHYYDDLDKQIRTALDREGVLWVLFIIVFILTLTAGTAGVILIFLASLKVAIASGAAGLIPGCTSALLKRECTTQIKRRQAIEAKRDEQLRLRQATAAIAELPPSPQKDKLQIDHVRKIVSRIPK